MSKVLSFLLINVICFSAYCQTNSNVKQKVYKVNQINFYGYDFSAFQIVDEKRIGQDLKDYLFQLTDHLNEKVPELKLIKWLQINAIRFHFEPTFEINKKIKSENIVTASLHNIKRDSLQLLINNYSPSEKEGIGYVIIFECFNSEAKIASAYSVFFDIATKEILLIDYGISRDNNSYNRIDDWNLPAVRTVKVLTDKYSKARHQKNNSNY